MSEFRPVTNGLDYLQSAIEHLEGAEEPRDFKYAIIHLQAAAEVLLKVRLIREHWTLVFRDVSKANLDRFKRGDFISIGAEEAIVRLEGIASIEFSKDSKDALKALSAERNKLQHFGYEVQGLATGSLASKALNALLSFIMDHLIPQADEEDQVIFDETLVMIQSALRGMADLAHARLLSISAELDKFSHEVVICPQCDQMALRLNPKDFKCYFCNEPWHKDPENAASEYAGAVHGFSWRDIADGADDMIIPCPECGVSSFVQDVYFRNDMDNTMWACFSCGHTQDPNTVGLCSSCAEPTYGFNDTICSDCWDHLVKKD